MRYLAGIVCTAALVLFAVAFTLMALNPDQVEGACEYYTPNPPNEPTGVKGCEIYGEGFASMWGGPGVARNDCVWPWTACQPIRITSLDTGISVDRTPTMYGDLYTGTPEWRIVDLDPPTVAALGLNPTLGLWRVTVEPVGLAVDDVALPDTAMAMSPNAAAVLLGCMAAVLMMLGVERLLILEDRYRPSQRPPAALWGGGLALVGGFVVLTVAVALFTLG